MTLNSKLDINKKINKNDLSQRTDESITKQSSWELLNDKQKLFCLSYLQSFIATKAYKEAYPSAKSDEAAAVSAARLLRNDKVSQAISEKLNSIWDDKEQFIGRALSEILALSFSDISQIVDIKKGILTMKDLNNVDTRIIQSIKTTRTADSETITITMHNKIQSLSLLSKILNMVTEKTEISGTIEIIPAQRPKVIVEASDD